MSNETTSSAKQACFALIHEHILAFPANFVRQVLDNPVLTPVPRTETLLKGLFAFQGSIYPLIDTSYALGLSDVPSQENPVVIIVEHQGKHFGLNAKQILGFTLYNSENLEIENIPAGAHPYFLAQTQINEISSLVLDLPSFLSHIQERLDVN